MKINIIIAIILLVLILIVFVLFNMKGTCDWGEYETGGMLKKPICCPLGYKCD